MFFYVLSDGSVVKLCESGYVVQSNFFNFLSLTRVLDFFFTNQSLFHLGNVTSPLMMDVLLSKHHLGTLRHAPGVC